MKCCIAKAPFCSGFVILETAPPGPYLSPGFLDPGWLHGSCPQLPLSQQEQACTLSPHARAFSEHLSLLSASWHEAGEGPESCGAWLKGKALHELAKEWKGTWQMVGRAALAPGPGWLSSATLTLVAVWAGSTHWPGGLACGPNGFYRPEEH